MAKKQWIKVHSGLTDDPVHRDRIGNRIWYFMWLIRKANWKNGVVEFYTDAQAAEDMSDPDEDICLSPRTVERWRQELADMGYIKCHKGDQCQHIRIMKWRNPEDVEPTMINVPDNQDTWAEYAKMRTPSRSNLRTPSIEDHIDTHPVVAMLERHFALSVAGAVKEQWIEKYERGGAEIFEAALIATVKAGGGRKMNIDYVTAIIDRMLAERDGNLTFNERMALMED